MSNYNGFRSKVHHGNNVRRLRELLNKRQDELADMLNVSQQRVSKFENQEEIDDDVLDRIAKVLGIPVEAITNLTDDAAVNMISNTFNFEDSKNATVNGVSYQFNPIEKFAELYERMLAKKDEEINLLKKALEEKK